MLILPGALPRPLAFCPTALTPVENGAVRVWEGSGSFPLKSHLVCAQIFAQLAQVFGEFGLFLRVQNNAEYF